MKGPEGPGCVLCVDMGTTNTRIWAVSGSRIAARLELSQGVRDTARSGSPQGLWESLRQGLESVREQARLQGLDPAGVVACGMITSSLGLLEIPHVPAPAGLDDLAQQVRHHRWPPLCDLDLYLVPGVACGGMPERREQIGQVDLMRGEETLCLGLLQMGRLSPGGLLLSLGSHWKTIQVDRNGRIAWSRTALTGELMHAVQTQTILAAALPKGRPEELDWEWARSGMREERRSGLTRTLFCVRLLEQHRIGTPQTRLAYLVGAFVSAELRNLPPGVLAQASDITLAASGGWGEVFQQALREMGREAERLQEEEREQALLAGMCRLLEAAQARRRQE